MREDAVDKNLTRYLNAGVEEKTERLCLGSEFRQSREDEAEAERKTLIKAKEGLDSGIYKGAGGKISEKKSVDRTDVGEKEGAKASFVAQTAQINWNRSSRKKTETTTDLIENHIARLKNAPQSCFPRQTPSITNQMRCLELKART